MDRRKLLISTFAGIFASKLSAADGLKTPLKVGVLVPLSGPGAEFGDQERAAFEAVISVANQNGGIEGTDLSVIAKDTKSDATEAARLANQLILDDRVIAIATGTGADTLAVADLAMRSEIPLFFMGSTLAATDKKAGYFRWVFRTCTTATDDAELIRNRIVKDGHKRIAIFHSEDAFGQQSAELASRISRERGDLDVVLTVSASVKATDLTAPALAIRRANIDAVMIFSGAGVTMAGSFLRKLRELGSKVPAYGPAALAQPALIRISGEAAEGMTLAAIFNADEAGPLQPLFDVLKSHGGARGFGSLLGAAAASTIVEGLRFSTSTKTSLRDAVENMPPFSPYTAGRVKYTADKHDGWGAQNLLIVQVKNGRFVNLN